MLLLQCYNFQNLQEGLRFYSFLPASLTQYFVNFCRHPDVRSSARPAVRMSGRPNFQTSGRPDFRLVEWKPKKLSKYSEQSLAEFIGLNRNVWHSTQKVYSFVPLMEKPSTRTHKYPTTFPSRRPKTVKKRPKTIKISNFSKRETRFFLK